MTIDTPDAAGDDVKPPATSAPDCLCMGLGPQLTALLRGLVPTGTLAETLRGTELDALTFLKTIIDQRIANLSGTAADSKGTRVVIE